MTARPLILLAALAAVPAPAQDPRTPATKTWDLLAPGDKEPDKLPVTGPVPNVWDRHRREARSDYLTTQAQLTELWKVLGQTGPVPEVDFKTHTVVLIRLKAPKVAIKKRDDGTPILDFEIQPQKGGEKDRPYTLATFPKEQVEAVLKTKK